MDQLAFIEADTATTRTTLSLGAVAPSSSDDTQLSITNTSSLFQAGDVTVRVAGTDADQLWLSTDGDTFGVSIDVGDIAPGGSSAPFWLRRVTPSTATGSCSAQLSAAPTQWTAPLDTSGSANVPLNIED